MLIKQLLPMLAYMLDLNTHAPAWAGYYYQEDYLYLYLKLLYYNVLHHEVKIINECMPPYDKKLSH